MFWKFIYKNKKYYSWGKPRSLPIEECTEITEDYTVKVYSGEEILSNQKVLFSMQGDATLGMGDCVWLISYIRDVYRIKGKRKCKFYISTSETIAEYLSNFLPNNFIYLPEYLTEEEFNSYDHILPAMYYWKEKNADKSWVDNKSILERLYDMVGIEYQGLPDFGEFTNPNILYFNDGFLNKFNIDPEEKYVFFQWHSSGHCKNLPPKTNIKIIKHLIKKYNYKVYVIGRLNSLAKLEEIEGVRNFSNKTLATEVIQFAFNSDLIVCPDSAGLHLGEAFTIPTVSVMATLPPVYVAKNYKTPAFIFGAGRCPFKPCGHVDVLPLEDKCPKGTKNYCAVLDDINLDLFDKCIEKTRENVRTYRNKQAVPFYECQFRPFTLKKD